MSATSAYSAFWTVRGFNTRRQRPAITAAAAKNNVERPSKENHGASTVSQRTKNSRSPNFITDLGEADFESLSLHFVETTDNRLLIRAGLEDLPERIDLSIITDIVSSQTLAQANQARSPLSSSSSKFPPLSPALTKAHSNAFSLHSANGVIAELQASDSNTYSEWIDGLSMLKPNGYITTRETADLVQALTDIGVKIKLLDLTGEHVQIPSQVQVSALRRFLASICLPWESGKKLTLRRQRARETFITRTSSGNPETREDLWTNGGAACLPAFNENTKERLILGWVVLPPSRQRSASSYGQFEPSITLYMHAIGTAAHVLLASLSRIKLL